jgi:ectoine hydroxylase-related dioxygenase (phytanoyl-CoA dioxygenase family)
MTVEHASEVISQQEREQFERDGYLLIGSTGCPETLLDTIVSEVEEYYSEEQRTEDGVFYAPRRVRNAWKINDNVKSLALSKKVLVILEALYGRRPLPFQTINFKAGTQQAAHSDALHFGSKPEGYLCGVWVALEDIHADSGPLVYYPGSHRFPELSMRDLGLESDRAAYPQYTRAVEDQIERQRLEPAYATLKKGEALLWASNLLHGGATHKDKRRTRHSQVTHYFFEGCKYYVPMVNDPENIEWWTPGWIA